MIHGAGGDASNFRTDFHEFYTISNDDNYHHRYLPLEGTGCAQIYAKLHKIPLVIRETVDDAIRWSFELIQDGEGDSL